MKQSSLEPYRSPLILLMARFYFYFHLLATFTYSIILIIQYPYIITPTFSFTLVVIYGFMLAWIGLINLLTCVLSRMGCIAWIFRIGIKMLFAIFPILAYFAYKQEKALYTLPLKFLGYYMFAFAIIYVVYEICCLVCLEKTQKQWVYKVTKDDLKEIKELIHQKRKQFEAAT